MINKGIIPVIYIGLKDESPILKKVVAFTLSNLMCAEPYQLQSILTYPNMLTQLVSMIHKEEDKRVVNECLFCLTNATFKGNSKQTDLLVENGVLNVFQENLINNQLSIDLIVEILTALINILNNGEIQKNKPNSVSYAEKMEMSGFKKVLEDMQNHKNEEISKKVALILDKFLGSSCAFEI